MSKFVRVNSDGDVIYRGRVDKSIPGSTLVDQQAAPLPSDIKRGNEYQYNSLTGAWVPDTTKRTTYTEKEARTSSDKLKISSEMIKIRNILQNGSTDYTSAATIKIAFQSLHEILKVMNRG